MDPMFEPLLQRYGHSAVISDLLQPPFESPTPKTLQGLHYSTKHEASKKKKHVNHFKQKHVSVPKKETFSIVETFCISTCYLLRVVVETSCNKHVLCVLNEAFYYFYKRFILHVCHKTYCAKRETCFISKLQPCYGTLSQKENIKTCLPFHSDTCLILDASTTNVTSASVDGLIG